MINVLMLGNHPSNKGGMTSVISQIMANNWEKEGIKLSFIPTFIPGNAIKKILFFAKAYVRFLGRCIFRRPDIVHMHMSYKGSFTRKYRIHRLCKLFGIKDIIHLHGSEFEKWYNSSPERKKTRIRRLLSECDRFVVLGEGWNSVVKRIEPLSRTCVIRNGIEIPNERVFWSDECCQILFLGVLIPRKGVSDLIKAISIIKKMGKMSNLHFVIAGTGEDEQQLKNQTMEMDLVNYVDFAGWVTGEKKTDLILKSQILVSPSYNEGLPISLLEAASYGMPIVSTDVGDISAVVKDGLNGFLIQPGDVESLAEEIMEVSEKTTFEKMARESRRIAEDFFSIESFYANLTKLYHTVGNGNE